MNLSGIKPIFGGHEKFVFRYGWLKKGIDAINENPLVFADEEALTTLGVGKNMVRSIRHWCLAIGLATETKDASRARPLKLTKLAQKLIAGKNSWYPYFEDIGSLWLLHWQLTNNLVRGYVWNLSFHPIFNLNSTRSRFNFS